MSDSTLSAKRHKIFSIAACGLLILLFSCGGNKDRLADESLISPVASHGNLDLPQITGNPLVAVPGLPSGDPLATPDRNLSFTNIVSYNGNGIFDSTPQNLYPNNTTVLPSTLDEIAWARYAFNTGGYQPERLSVDLTCNAGSVAYVGYSNYQTGHWDWEQPASGPVSYDLPEGLYLNSTDQFFVVVLTAGGSTATVKSLSVRFDNDVIYDNSISGTILDEHGAPLASQFLSVSPNPDFVNVVTDVDGTYIIGLSATGMYTVEPQSMNVAYTPVSEMVDVQGNETGVDFSGTRIDIRGRIANTDGIGLSGVLLTLNPGGSTTISGADGEYEFQAVADGAYTVVPLLATYSFDPANANANVNGADEENVNFEFTGGQPTFGIFGNISEAGSSPVPDVVVVLNPGYRLAFTDSNGNYSFTNQAPGMYTVGPVKGNWSFTPALRQVNIDTGSVNNTDFTAIPPPPTYVVSGHVRWFDNFFKVAYAVPGVTAQIEMVNGSRKVLYSGATDDDGMYSIPNVLAGDYQMSIKGFGYSPNQVKSFSVADLDTTVDLFIELVGGKPTWKNFAASYIGNQCTSCHRPDSQTSVSPFLRDYDEVVDTGSSCNARIQNGTMPPGNPSKSIHKRYFSLWRNDGYPLE